MLADVSAMMSSEFRRHCNHYFIFFLSFLRDVFPQLPVQPSTECTRTDTLQYDPFFFYGTCLKTQSQTNRPTPLSTAIATEENHSLPLFVSLTIVPSPPPSEKQWGRYLSFLEERILFSEWEHNANSYVNLLFVLVRHVI